MSDPIVSAKRMSAAREAVVAGSVVAAAVVVLMLAPGLGPTGPVLVAGLAWSATLVLAAAASTTFGRAGDGRRVRAPGLSSPSGSSPSRRPWSPAVSPGG